MSGPATPLPLRVRLPFESEEAFIRRFGSNVSASGIFIPTRSLKPEGTHLRFELVLADGTRLLRGGVVVQDAIEAAPGRRGGMELAFTELDAHSHEVLARVLAARPPTPGASEGLGVPSWRRAPPVHPPPAAGAAGGEREPGPVTEALPPASAPSAQGAPFPTVSTDAAPPERSAPPAPPGAPPCHGALGAYRNVRIARRSSRRRGVDGRPRRTRSIRDPSPHERPRDRRSRHPGR